MLRMNSFQQLMDELPQMRIDSLELTAEIIESDWSKSDKVLRVIKRADVWMKSAQDLKEHALVLHELTKLRKQRLNRHKAILQKAEDGFRLSGLAEDEIQQQMDHWFRAEQNEYYELLSEATTGVQDKEKCLASAEDNEKTAHEMLHLCQSLF